MHFELIFINIFIKLKYKMEAINSVIVKKLVVATVGCLHGRLGDLYYDLENYEKENNVKIDLVLCCGDFQSIKTKDDLAYISCPDKYKEMGQFHEYAGNKTNKSSKNAKTAPYLTIFVGGNHEASNILEENFYGGFIAPNIFYLGRAGVIKTKGVRIAGISGIFKSNDYYKGHFETDLIKHIKSIYHVREIEIAKLSHLNNEHIDFFMSHDWPTGAVKQKDFKNILHTHYHWKEELETDTLGSPASGYLLKLLKPSYWLSGHMHYVYSNDIEHTNSKTKFIALDKPAKRRKYFDVIEHEFNINKDFDPNDNNIYLDPEWLAILKTFNDYIPVENKIHNLANFFDNKDEYVNALINVYIPTFKNQKFEVTVPSELKSKMNTNKEHFKSLENIEWKYLLGKEQKDYILGKIGITDFLEKRNNKLNDKCNKVKNNEEIDVDVDIDFI